MTEIEALILIHKGMGVIVLLQILNLFFNFLYFMFRN